MTLFRTMPLLVGVALAAPVGLPMAQEPAAGTSAVETPLPEPGSRVPPLHRIETYHRAAVEFLEALPETSRIRVERASGARFELELSGGRIAGRLPPSSLSGDGTVLSTPLGFRISPGRPQASAIVITAPNGKSSEFTRRDRRVIVSESDGNLWNSPKYAQPLRLPDATRIDMLDDVNLYEVVTLLGERFRYDASQRAWTALTPIPSPPLIPDLEAGYLAGDGDDWRFPYPEDHTVFAWSWYPYGFTIENVLEESWRGFRKSDLEELFKNIEIMPQPAELGAYFLARRLSLGGGDRMILETPGDEPFTAYLLPGPLDPNFFLPRVRDWNLILRHNTDHEKKKPR